jgi:hypothetical protein
VAIEGASRPLRAQSKGDALDCGPGRVPRPAGRLSR